MYTQSRHLWRWENICCFPGVKFLLSERFTQDPLETFFGHQRQRGGGSDNPNVLQFTYATSAIRAQKAITSAVRGNVRGSKHHRRDGESIETPLPKKCLGQRQITFPRKLTYMCTCIQEQYYMYISLYNLTY